jgi:hypothetical protein
MARGTSCWRTLLVWLNKHIVVVRSKRWPSIIGEDSTLVIRRIPANQEIKTRFRQ